MTEPIRSADLLVRTALSRPDIMAAMKVNPEETLKSLGVEVTRSLPRVLSDPGPTTNNMIWLIIVGAFVAVMLFSAYILGTGVDTKLDANALYVTKGETVLTLFTTVVAFLAGLLSPSPVKK